MSNSTQTPSSQTRTQRGSTDTTAETHASPETGSESHRLEVEASDQELARTAAISLGVWLTLTLAAVGILMLTGDSISAVFV